MRIAIEKEEFNRKMSVMTSKLNMKFWSITLYGSDTWTLRKLERKYLESFEMLKKNEENWCKQHGQGE